MPEQLLAAVRELTKTVKDLERTLHLEYPKRAEVEQRFTSKTQAKTRLIGAALTLILALVASFFVTTSTISYCFLGGAETGKHPPVCNAIPGYKEAQDSNKILIKQFENLVENSERNERRIKRLERRVR